MAFRTINKRKLQLIILGCILAIIFGFRFTPLLIPIREEDLKRKSFHSVRFYDRNGKLLQEVLSENSTHSVSVDLDKVSPYFIQAIIASEDKNFYYHNGVDYKAIFRAFLQNLKAKKVVSGASTITLQLARMVRPGKRTFLKKIKEAYFAYRLEAGLSKEKILEAYVNRIPMGGNLYGVEAGSKAYFGISSSDLTLAQASFLASIPNSPTRLNPYKNLEEIRRRQRYILEKMAKGGLIEEERIERVLKEDISLLPQTASFAAPHFVFTLLKDLPEEVQNVRVPIDLELQKMVQEQVNRVIKALSPFNVTNAAVILLDNFTGEVLAYVGSADFFDTEHNGEYDAVRALRQPGSTLKPFLYLLAFEDGFTPATVVSDIPTHYRMPTGIYSPKNYSKEFYGPIRVREALANSLNVPATRILVKVGIDRFLNRLKEYEFNSLDKDADYYGVGLVLGGGEVSLFELGRAYMCLARLGSFIPIKEILEIDGEEKKYPESNKIISRPELNYLIADILSDKFARTSEFGFNSVLNFPFPCAVKTGTSFRFCDNWTVGFTEDYTLAVWVGNFDHTPMQKVSGVSGAGPLFANIMYLLYSRKDFPEKKPLPEELTRVKICPLSGKKPTHYCPSVVEEIIPIENLIAYYKDSCDMHSFDKGKVYTVLPGKYKEWVEGFEAKNTSNKIIEEERFKIVHPKDGAIFYRLSNVKPEYQSIKIELTTTEEGKVHWFLNGKPLKETTGEHSFLWQIKPGNYCLQAVSDKDKDLSSQVNFIVK
ncbi:MAG: penicillin-binding protein 1C [candidate division WOR-3 bacterium]